MTSNEVACPTGYHNEVINVETYAVIKGTDLQLLVEAGRGVRLSRFQDKTSVLLGWFSDDEWDVLVAMVNKARRHLAEVEVKLNG